MGSSKIKNEFLSLALIGALVCGLYSFWPQGERSPSSVKSEITFETTTIEKKFAKAVQLFEWQTTKKMTKARALFEELLKSTLERKKRVQALKFLGKTCF